MTMAIGLGLGLGDYPKAIFATFATVSFFKSKQTFPRMVTFWTQLLSFALVCSLGNFPRPHREV
jgi:hypothetical protein